MNKLQYWFRLITQLNLPILKNTILFRSFYGQYNDNPKYVYEELVKSCKDLNIVWVVGVGKKHTFPSNAKTVELDSKEYIKYIARAEVVVDNYSGARTNFLKGNNFIKKLLFKYVAKKRKGQLNISTWHGTPLKKIALDEPQYKNTKAYLNANVLLSGCDITSNAYLTAFNWKGEILKVGTPRNDLLFKTDLKIQTKEKLGLPIDKKVVLFAPTFRDDLEMSGLYQMKNLNLDGLLTKLASKFGGEWCFVFRTHNLVFQKIQEEGLILNENVINGNEFDDMAEYLLSSDVLITDYSSSMFDYLLSKNPCFLFTPDLENYKNTERGFYLDIETLPFKPCETVKKFFDEIDNFDNENYLQEVDRYLKEIGNTENGESSKKVVELIKKHLTK